MAKDLKTTNPDLKILIAIGGWNHGSGPFTAMVSTQSNIDHFAANSLTFLRTHDFDGLDLDWEYPATLFSYIEPTKAINLPLLML
jgi:chitinase